MYDACLCCRDSFDTGPFNSGLGRLDKSVRRLPDNSAEEVHNCRTWLPGWRFFFGFGMGLQPRQHTEGLVSHPMSCLGKGKLIRAGQGVTGCLHAP